MRTVVATMADSETFGWQVAAEVHGRGLDRAKRKACVGDGQKYNWSIYEMHLLPLGFIAILDFVHLLAYLHAAAHAWKKADRKAAWKQYQQWLRWAWSGQGKPLLARLREAAAQMGEPPAGAGEDDPRQIVADALTYVTNNRTRMDYPRYRRQGLPTTSSLVESLVGEFNARVKGKQKFWSRPAGAEAMLQVRAALLSEDERLERYFADRPGSPYRRRAA